MIRVQRSRLLGSRIPEGAIYVGRPSPFGNPWPIDDRDRQPWLAIALGYRADKGGRRAAVVAAYRWWLNGRVEPFPVPVQDPGRSVGTIEYGDGTTRTVTDVVVGMGVFMLGRAGTIMLPEVPDLTPLIGAPALSCWCPIMCPTCAGLGTVFEKAKPRIGDHPPGLCDTCRGSGRCPCHADVLIEVLSRAAS